MSILTQGTKCSTGNTEALPHVAGPLAGEEFWETQKRLVRIAENSRSILGRYDGMAGAAVEQLADKQLSALMRAEEELYVRTRK